MKSASQDLLDAIPNPKTLGIRATFRVMRPSFDVSVLNDSLGITDPTLVDACAYGTGILRVTNYNGYLYTQYIDDVEGTWPNWVNTNIALWEGSRPGVDGGYVWYQKDGDVRIFYRDYRDWSAEVCGREDGDAYPEILAPIRNERCYSFYLGANDIGSLSLGVPTEYEAYWYSPPFRIQDVTAPRIDAVEFDTEDGPRDFVYYTDRDAGRIIELINRPQYNFWGEPTPIVSIDAIDDDYGLNLHGAEVVDGKVVVTARMTRTSDGDPVSMDVYLLGPENFSLGRDMFIARQNIGGKIIPLGTKLVVPGVSYVGNATGTDLFGIDNPSQRLTTSEIENLSIQEAENRSGAVTMSLSPALSHAAISKGSHVTVEVAYNDEWMTAFTGEIDRVSSSNGNGQDLTVELINLSAKRLNMWSPEQGVYIPSQAWSISPASDASQLIRVHGHFSEDGDELSVDNFNDLAIAYTAARAGKNGVMRARFWNESASDPTMRSPRFGVGINYYRESKVEAAVRLGIEYTDVDDDLCGDNGFFAVYGRTEYNNSSSGITLYRVENSTWNVISHVSVTLPLGQPVWLQIRHRNGYIYVHYRADSSTTWTMATLTFYGWQGSPWFNEEKTGHGAVVLERRLLKSSPCYGFSSDNDIIAVDDNSKFTAPGTILVDNELISISGKSTYNTATPTAYADEWAVRFTPRFSQVSGFDGYRICLWVSADTRINYNDNAFVDAALAVVEDTAGYPHTFQITGYDKSGFNIWEPSPFTSGYSIYIGQSGHGSWISTDASAFYVLVDPFYYIRHTGEMDDDHPYTQVRVKPSLFVSARGASGTAAVQHNNTTAYAYADIQLYCDRIEYFTGDEDISLADALRRVIRLAGGEFNDKKLVDTDLPADNTWNIIPVPSDASPDFISEIYIPAGILSSSNAQIGMIFRSQSAVNETAPAEGYFLARHFYGYLNLYQIGSSGSLTLLEQVVPNYGMQQQNGVLKVSVKDNRFSIWMDHVFLHSFVHEGLTTGNFKAFAYYNPSAATLPDAHVIFSELNDLMSEIVVGMRGKGMNVVAEMIDNRNTYFRSEPDGSLYFWKTTTGIGTLPDIVVAESHEQVDDQVSRVRMEGIAIAEIADFAAMKAVGNVFITANSMYSETVQDLVRESQRLVTMQAQRADTRTLDVVYHPALQPGDQCTVEIDGNDVEFGVFGTSVFLGFNGDTFMVDANLQVYAL